MITGGLVAGTLGMIIQNNTYDFGLRVGNIIAVITSSGVSFLILKEKNVLGNFGLILLALLSGFMALYLGGLVGLIPAAYLSTRTAK